MEVIVEQGNYDFEALLSQMVFHNMFVFVCLNHSCFAKVFFGLTSFQVSLFFE